MDNKNMNFEEGIALLEDYVRKLEGGALSLDESIDAYTEALKLVKLCNDKLENAEQRVRILTEGKDGSVTDLPFDKYNED